MNSEFFVIQPFIETISKTITQYKIIVQDLVLFKSVSIRLDCFDSNNLYVKSKDIIIEGEDYNNWLNNDQYIIDHVNKVLGFTTPTPQIDSNNLHINSQDIIIEGEENNNRLNDNDNKILDSIPTPQIDSQV